MTEVCHSAAERTIGPTSGRETQKVGRNSGPPGCGAGNDLAGAAGFLTCFALLAVGGRPNAPHLRSAALSGLALGFCVGVKGTNLLFAPLALAAAVVRFRSWAGGDTRRVVALTTAWLLAAAVGGGYWYARNAVLSGNPLFPVRVEVAGVVAADGPLDRSAMRDGGWFDPDRRYVHLLDQWNRYLGGTWATVDLGGGALPLGVLAAAAVAAAFVLARLPWAAVDRRGFVEWLAVPIAGALMFWHVNPHTSQTRLAAGPLLMALLWPALLAAAGRPRLALLLLAAPIGSGLAQEAVSMARFGDAWGWSAAGLAGAVVLTAHATRGRPTARVAAVGLLTFGGGFAALAAGVGAPAADRDVQFARAVSVWERAAPFDRQVAAMWRVVDDRTRRTPGVVAYVGADHPYLLTGARQRNRVVSIAPNEQQGWTLR
ncbi:MAG: hypothetical protein ACRC1K_21150, partial [Planctomycetia bacterium]